MYKMYSTDTGLRPQAVRLWYHIPFGGITKLVKRSFTILILAVLSFSYFMTFYSVSQSYAIGSPSAYDNIVRTTAIDSLQTLPSLAGTCPAVPYNIADIETYIQDVNKWDNTANYTSYSAAYLLAYSSGSVAVSSRINRSNGQTSIFVYFTQDTDTSLSWTTSDVSWRSGSTNSPKIIEIQPHKDIVGSGTCEGRITGSYTGSLSTDYIIGNADDITNSLDHLIYFVHGSELNYPIGYLGQNIPTTMSNGSNIPLGIELNLNGLDLTARYTNNININKSNSPRIRWTLARFINNGYPDLDIQDLPIDQAYTYSLPEFERYALGAELLLIPPPILPPAVTVVPAQIKFNATGENQTINNMGVGCVYGVCDEPAQYLNCDSFVTDFTAALKCNLTNMVTKFKSMLMTLLVPNPKYFKQSVTDMYTKAQERLGFLIQPIVFVVDFANAFTSTTDNWCNSSDCTKSFGTFYGQPVNINFLAIRDYSPQVWTYTTLLARAGLIFVLLVSIRRKYMEIMRK